MEVIKNVVLYTCQIYNRQVTLKNATTDSQDCRFISIDSIEFASGRYKKLGSFTTTKVICLL